jgi:quercetin dioxygenase-like cupin family protein
MNRRDLCLSLPALALAAQSLGPPETAAAQASNPANQTGMPTKPTKPTAAPKTCEEPLLSQCAAFPFDSMKIRYSDDGALTHQIVEGKIPNGENLEMHETTLEPGKMPHPAHRHPHAELLLIREGTIEFITATTKTTIPAGSAAYCAPNQLHGFRNSGTTKATYFIVKIGAVPVCQT